MKTRIKADPNTRLLKAALKKQRDFLDSLHTCDHPRAEYHTLLTLPPKLLNKNVMDGDRFPVLCYTDADGKRRSIAWLKQKEPGKYKFDLCHGTGPVSYDWGRYRDNQVWFDKTVAHFERNWPACKDHGYKVSIVWITGQAMNAWMELNAECGRLLDKLFPASDAMV